MASATGETPLEADRAVFGEIYPGDATSLGNPSRDVAYRWVRKGRWKLIVSHSHGGAKPWGGYLDSRALFDVVDDPDESTNRIDDPAHAPRAAELLRLLNDWWTPGDDSAVPKPSKQEKSQALSPAGSVSLPPYRSQ